MGSRWMSRGVCSPRRSPSPLSRRNRQKKKGGRSGFLQRTAAKAGTSAGTAVTAQAQLAGAQRIPSAMEGYADPADLQAIRDIYGSRAQERRPPLLVLFTF